MDAVERIAEMAPDIVVLEPTGSYSTFLVESLEHRAIPYVFCNQTLVRQTRKSFAGTDNKDDPFDAVLMAWLYRERYLRTFDRRFWLKARHPKIKDLRSLMLDIKSTTKKSTAITNSLKQRFARGEWIEKSKVQTASNRSLHPDRLPAFWAWLCGWTKNGSWELSKSYHTRFGNQYHRALEKGEATEISQETKDLARCLCLLELTETRLAIAAQEILYSPIFEPYNRVFSRFEFGDRERAWLLVRIYPFEDFLGEDGRAIVDYTQSVTRPGQKHKTAKPRSKRRFKQALGVGRTEGRSGTSVRSGSKMKGSAEARSTLWLYLNNNFEKRLNSDGSCRRGARCKSTQVRERILEQFLKRAFVERDGRLEKKSGDALRAARNGTSRKIAEILFSELLKELGSQSY
ncbi:transposase [Oxynema sp. CENA135]|uniref:IS110 family transposase n=1 Tax=Oxynema sp. CENA135 TaxID=984206 RepID=UPI00190A5FDB|nr:transposase [Oxynema sp. CENA135]MBK4732575.1 transposase [Oxynema sp. CENA135]